MMNSLSTQLITGDQRSIKVSDAVQLWKSIASISAPAQGKIQRLGENAYSLTNYFTTTDVDNLETVKTLKVYSLTTKDSKDNGGEYIDSVRCISDMHEVSLELASATSKNGRFLARLKSSSTNSKQELLEIWDRAKLVKTIDISELDVHGSISTDPVFSNFVWTPFGDQDKLLYVCQRKRSKFISFFKESLLKKDNAADENDDTKPSSSSTDSNRGEEYLKRDNWGEFLGNIEHTLIAVLDVANNCQITTIDVDNHSLGAPSWLDNGTKIVSMAYKEESRRLGRYYCNNRPSKIMVHDWQTSDGGLVLELESDSECFHSPRVNNAGDKFLYLSNSVYGAHMHAVKMNIYDFIARASETLVDQSTKRSELFIEELPQNCFTTDDKHILFVESDHLYHHMCLFSLNTSKLSHIKFPTTGLSIKDFRYDVILASGSEVNATSTLFVAKLKTSDISDVVAWHQIEDCIHLNEIDYEAFKIPTSDGSSFVSALLTKPDVKTLRQNFKVEDDGSILTHTLPTIVMVHGGPHSAFTLKYIPVIEFFTKLGLQTLQINYRGSTGVDENYIKSLCGKVGELDVEDCMHVIRYFVKEKIIDPAKLIIYGGSHGGFLSCHLSCQDEFKFTSAIIRNPVTDLYSMYASDIPDWAHAEALGFTNFDASIALTTEQVTRMYKQSPMSKADKANVPTLMHLGSKDLRVPMFQGEKWVDAIRARGVETHCKVYPDGHALSKPEVSADSNITIAIWILTHLPANK